MDEQAQVDAYEIFKSGGYNGSQEEFIELISSNQDAFSDSLSMFKEGGYNGSPEEYAALIGVGSVDKKEPEEDEKDINLEADERVTSITTDIPSTEAEVNNKYDDYLNALIKDEDDVLTLENLNLDQTLAKDQNGEPLKGQKLLEHVQKIQQDKNDLLDLVKNQGDEIGYAKRLKEIQLKTIPTEEEIQAEMIDTRVSGAVGGIRGGVDEDGNSVSSFGGVGFGEEYKLHPMLLTPYNELTEDEKKQRLEQEKINTNSSSVMGGLGYSPEAISKVQSNKEAIVQVTSAAKELGYKVTTDKEKADDKTIYIPNRDKLKIDKANWPAGATEDNFDPYWKYDSEILNLNIPEEVRNKVHYNIKKKRAADGKLQSKEIRDEIDEVLEEFEGEKGVSGWNNVVNMFATIGNKYMMEKTLGLTVDELLGMKEGSREGYKQNQKELADAIGLSQKGDDLKVASTIYDMQNEARGLLAQEAVLKEMARKLESNPNRTQEDIDKFYELRDDLMMTQAQIKANYEYLGDLEFSGTNVNEILEKTQKSYDELHVLENIFLNSGVRIVTGLGALVNEMNMVNVLEFAGIDLKDENVRSQYGEFVEDVFGESAGNLVEGSLDAAVFADKSADEGLKALSQYGQGLMDEIKEQQRFDEIDGFMDGFLWGTQMLTGQALNTAMSVVVPGGGGLIISALAESGNQMYDMKTRMEGEKWSESELSYINDYKNEFGINPLGNDDVYKIQPEEINALQFYGTAALYGSAEYFSEKITLGNFKMGAKNIRKAFDLSKTKGIVSSNKINQRWLNLKQSAKDFATGVPGESIGEGMVTLTQNFGEKYILGNQDVSLLDGMTESMVSGAVMSGTMQGPAIIAQTYQAFRGPDRNAKIAQRGADILRLSNSIKANELKLSGLKNTNSDFKNISEAIRLETKQMHDLAKEQLQDQSKIRSEVLTLIPQDRQQLIDIFNAEHKVRSKIDKINNNTATSPKTAATEISKLQKELVGLEAVKNFTLSNAEWNADKNRATKFSNAYRAKNNTLGEVEMIVGNNNKEALDAGLSFIDSRNDLSKEEKNQVKQLMKEQFEEADIASRGDQTVNGMAFGDNIKLQTTDANNVTTEKTLNIPITFALNRNNSTVQSHEIGHHTLFKQFMDNNPDAVGLVQDLETYVKRNYKEAYQNFLETKQLYGKYDSKGDLVNKEMVAEEKLARLSDFMRQNDLQSMRTLNNKLFGRFKKFNDGSGQIKDGKDVFDMLVSFNQSFETGKLTGLTKSIAEGTAEISRKNKGIKKDSKPVSKSKLSLTKGEKDSIEDTLNDAPGQRNKDGKYTMTKAEWRADKNRAFSKAYNALMNGDLDGLIIAKMASGKDIFGQAREEFIEDARLKIGQHMLNFDPQGRDSLFGWVNAYIGKKVGDVANKAKREKAKQPGVKISTDQKLGDEGGATVADTIKGDDADSIIEAIDAKDAANEQDAIIDNLRTRLGIEKGGELYNKVVQAVEKTFGRTKLKDVTNTEFKQDLKNKLNTELFKEVKNYLGTRKKFEEFINGKVSFTNKDGKTKVMPRWKMLFNYFSQGVVNKRFEQFKEPLINPETGKQARPDNNPLFRKRDDITQEEWTNYFLGKDVGASTKGTRKDALAAAIAEELAFDATMEVLEDSDIQNKIKEFYELQGLKQAENFTEKVGKTIDRTPGSKFSITTIQNKDVNQQLQNYWTTENVREEINKGKSLITIFNEFYNKLNDKDQKSLSGVKSEIEVISTSRSIEGDALADYDFDAQMLENVEGKIPFNLDITNTKSFNDYVNNLISKDVIPNPIINVNGKEINLFKKPSLNTLTQEEFTEFNEGLETLGEFLPQSVKNNSMVVSALSMASGLKVEGREGRGTIKAIEIKKALDKNKSNNKTEVKNPKVQPPKWGDTRSTKGKVTKGINSLINDILTDPNFDPSNPKDTKKISDIINEKASPKQIAEIQELGIEVAKALNEMVNTQKPFTAGWWKAFNFANQILTQQTNANTGIFRMMHGVEAVSTTVGKNRPFRMEHNVQNSRFMQNIKAQILQDAINKLRGKDSKFDSNINNIYSLAKRNMMLLDKDVQVVADAKAGSPTFNQGIKALEQKFGKGWLTPERLEMIKSVAGTTALQKGFDPNHATVINNILPFGLADKTIHVPSGLTYDQLMLNQMQGKLAVDYISSVTDGIKKQIENSTLGKEILKNPNTSTVIKENADASNTFNNMLAEASEKSIKPEIENNLNQDSIKLGLNIKFSESYNAKNEANSKLLNNSEVTNKFSKSKNTTKEVLDEATVLDKALNIARDPNAPIKKIRVFDFDDTLARTKSNVLYTMPDGTTGKLTAEQFAKDGDAMLAEGAVWDFSEFNKVMNGKKGPLFEVAQKIQEARGTKDVFVLTARAAEAAPAIKQFLDAIGLNIPIQNITGLGNSSPLAKSNWMVNKAAEGYNDFYFADDHLGNVDAVDKAMSVIDVKSKTQQAKIKFSKTADQTINDILEHKFGIKSEKEYSDVKAKLIGRKKGRGKFFIPPSAEDFVGLLYSMLGKGEIGDLQMEYFKDHLIEPYGRAMEDLSRDQNRMVNDFRTLKAQLVKEGLIPKNLNKKAFGEFTFQDVARILAWNKQGFEIPGISKADLNEVLKFAKENPAIDVFAGSLIDINKGDGYAKPSTDWLAGTISTDLLDGLRTGKRAKYLEQWQQNVDVIFSEKNLNKMEAAMGSKWREAMENMLGRMKSGKNRTSNGGRLENRLLDYVNNSVGTVMFFNMRSAILQTISSINFINWGGNNILKAGQAFANQPQYWKDFMELMNSDFLVERRNGLKLNVSESEIADAAATSKNKAKAAIAYILQKGYLPTQFADSFAIASGGATFYRNKIKELMKNGMSEADAKAQAFVEFREIAEESQQSSRPDRISQQQASGLGRVILAFANTPMQYNRLIKKAGQDLLNRRKKPGQTQLQSDFSNVSKMAYYAVIQNVIFNALQQAVFALDFDDEDDENAKQKYYNVANGMVDSILRGSGLAGVGVSTLIAMVRKVYKEAQKEGTFPGPDYADAAWELLNFSPPIDIKASKLRIAGNNWKYEGWKHDEAKWGIDDPAYKSAAYVISALTNIPVDRLFKKMDNIKGALDAEEETWKRVSQALGWTKWQLETTEDIKEFRAQEKPKKKQALKNMYGESNPEVYSKAEQQEILKGHGYSDEEIKAMKKEGERVEAILNKQKETGKVIKPKQARAYTPKKLMTVKQLKQEEEKAELKKQEEAKQLEIIKYKKLKKPRQVEMLDSLGLTKKQIRELQYEKDRVAKLIELMNK